MKDDLDILVMVKRVGVQMNRETYECDDIIITLNGRVQKYEYVVETVYNLRRGTDNMPLKDRTTDS